MRKDSRLSFRISNALSVRIDAAIDKSEGQIRDRSEFGTKAILHYLNYIENTQSEEEITLEALLALANKANVKSNTVKKVDKILKERAMIPKITSDKTELEEHPKFEELLKLRDKFTVEIQKEITDKLRDVTYNEIDDLYDKYREMYYLQGSGEKPSKSTKSEKKKLKAKN